MCPRSRSKLGGISPKAMGDIANHVTDERLMLDYVQGSPEAFTGLFHRYRQPIYAFFYRRLPNPNHGEELTQETFLALLRSAKRYEPRALFRTYLYALAFKILRAHRRKAIFRAAFFVVPETICDRGKQDSTEAAFVIRHALAKLDTTDREVLLLREFEQLSYAEIADLLQLPINTVRSRLFRARMALRGLLQARAAGPQTVAQNPAAIGERA